MICDARSFLIYSLTLTDSLNLLFTYFSTHSLSWFLPLRDFPQPHGIYESRRIYHPVMSTRPCAELLIEPSLLRCLTEEGIFSHSVFKFRHFRQRLFSKVKWHNWFDGYGPQSLCINAHLAPIQLDKQYIFLNNIWHQSVSILHCEQLL